MRTVLILGAGASYDYGFPLGEALIKNIREFVSNINSDESELLKKIGHSNSTISDFHRALYKTGRNTIDTFLSSKPQFIEIGKDSICIEILKREHEYPLRTVENNWYKLLYNKIIEDDFSLINNTSLTIITFNYDRSLEYYLIDTLKSDFNDEIAVKVFNKIKIVHIHGKLGELPLTDGEFFEGCLPYNSFKNHGKVHRDAFINEVYLKILHARKSFRTIFEQEENLINSNQPIIEALSMPCEVFFLGFGFDKKNLDLILKQSVLNPQVALHGTYYKSDSSQINELKDIFKRKYNKHIHLENLDCFSYLKNNRRW